MHSTRVKDTKYPWLYRAGVLLPEQANGARAV